MRIPRPDVEPLVGDAASRALLLDIADDVLDAVDAYRRVGELVRVTGDRLRVGHREWDLARTRHVYLIGAGKACNAMAMAVEHALGDRLTRGIAIVKRAEETDSFHRVEVHVGGHPIPNEDGWAATRKVLELVDAVGPDDLVIAVVSGGSTALMNAPVEGISVADEALASEVLITSGAGIREINAVRRHISEVNGGRLAARIRARGAELIGIGISDAIGRSATGDIGEPDVHYSGTPIGPDPTTIADARRMIRDYGLAERLPRSVLAHLAREDAAAETPKEIPGATYFLINTLPDLAVAAEAAAARRGLPVHVLTTRLAGESRDTGSVLAALAAEVQATGRPFAAPCLVVSCGETVTTILDSSSVAGSGGPSQELALGFALDAAEVPGAALLTLDTDGSDGLSPAAGAIVDSTSAARAAAAGIDLRRALRLHASFEALTAIGDSLVTGNTGTNLCDLNLLYIPAGPA